MFDLEFETPAACAERVSAGLADIGIVPSVEVARQDLEVIPGAGIACHGAVRSILLVSSRPAAAIRTLAADASSRTSVELARVILARAYGAAPRIFAHPPDLEGMLRKADAGLIIGDPALRIEPGLLPYHVYDLGAEWWKLTGLPMVFAVWAGRAGVATAETAEAFRASCRYGRERLEEIIQCEGRRRELDTGLVRGYLERHIVHELSPRDYAGMERFLEYAGQPLGADSPSLLY